MLCTSIYKLHLHAYVTARRLSIETHMIHMHGQMWNLVILFNFAFGGKFVQFGRKIYHLDGYFCLYHTQISENSIF